MRIFLLILFFMPFYVEAQSDSLRHELGISTQFVINSIFTSDGAKLPVEMLYKKSLHRSWLRLGLDFGFDNYKDSEYNLWGNQTHKYSRMLSPSLGIEHRKHVGIRWTVNYGMDLSYRFKYEKAYEFNHQKGKLVYSSWQRSYINSITGRPFAGLIFHINRYLSVASEASVSITTGIHFNEYHAKQLYHNGLEEKLEIRHARNELSRYDVGLNPASAIFVYYRF